MFDFFKKKHIPSEVKHPGTELAAAESQETAICEVESKAIKRITPTGTMTKLRKNEEVALSVLLRICEYLDCNICDVCDAVKIEE